MTHFFYYLASRACFSGRFIPSYVTKNVTCQELKTPVKAERARSAFNQKKIGPARMCCYESVLSTICGIVHY